MGPLTETFCRRWPELSNGMLNFLLQWEADHPFCGSTPEQVEAALAGALGASDGRMVSIKSGGPAKPTPWEATKSAFFGRLGQDPPEDERDKRIEELSKEANYQRNLAVGAVAQRDAANERAEKAEAEAAFLNATVEEKCLSLRHYLERAEKAEAEVDRLKPREVTEAAKCDCGHTFRSSDNQHLQYLRQPCHPTDCRAICIEGADFCPNCGRPP